MMEPEERRKLEELRGHVDCAKGFGCIDAAVGDLCKGKYYEEMDILECVDEHGAACKFQRAFGCTYVCICPLRRLIARNFDKWAAESTGVLRRTGNAEA